MIPVEYSFCLLSPVKNDELLCFVPDHGPMNHYQAKYIACVCGNVPSLGDIFLGTTWALVSPYKCPNCAKKYGDETSSRNAYPDRCVIHVLLAHDWRTIIKSC